MTPLEIKILLMRRRLTISALARKRAQQLNMSNIESVRKQLSMCINGEREYLQHQQFLADEIGKPRQQLFGTPARKAA